MRNCKTKLKDIPENQLRPVIEAIKKTVIFYMDQGFSWSYACATASQQAMFQKGDIIKALAKEPDMVALRTKYNAAKRFNKRKFLFGTEASKDLLLALEELERNK